MTRLPHCMRRAMDRHIVRFIVFFLFKDYNWNRLENRQKGNENKNAGTPTGENMAEKALYILAGYDDQTEAYLAGIQKKLYEQGFSLCISPWVRIRLKWKRS